MFFFTFETNQSFQSQSQTYQSQLNRRKQILDNTESSLKSQIAQLEGQLQRSHDLQSTQVTCTPIGAQGSTLMNLYFINFKFLWSQ